MDITDIGLSVIIMSRLTSQVHEVTTSARTLGIERKCHKALQVVHQNMIAQNQMRIGYLDLNLFGQALKSTWEVAYHMFDDMTDPTNSKPVVQNSILWILYWI